MKRFLSKAINIINCILRIFNTKLIRLDNDIFDMCSAVKRIHNHAFKIDNIIDIGASNGTWSINAMNSFPSASYVAIEPLQEREEALRTLNHKYPNFDFELCVAGDSNGGEAILNITDDLDGSTINGSGDRKRHVPIKTIDAIVAERHLSGTFLLKFDTHGYELPILKGAIETLKKTSVIIMEAYNLKITADSLRFHEICSHMECLGFRCYDIADLMLREYDKSFWQMDLLFCRNDNAIFDYHHYK